jgi:hypothetical protein
MAGWKKGSQSVELSWHSRYPKEAPRQLSKSRAWAGSVIKTGSEERFVLTDQEKWDKARVLVVEMRTMLENYPSGLNRKRLDQIRGFLQYVAQTYTSLTSYLIGVHMTIDSWQKGWNSEGWRLPLVSWRNIEKPDKD